MMLVIHIYGYHSVRVLLVHLYSKNILMQGLQINTFSHGMHTLTTHPKLQIINNSSIRLHSKHISQFLGENTGVL